MSATQVQLDELAAGLGAAAAQFGKAADEIDGRVKALEGQVAVLEEQVAAAGVGGDVDFSGVKASLADLSALAQRLDDVVPDVVVEPETVDGGADGAEVVDGGDTEDVTEVVVTDEVDGVEVVGSVDVEDTDEGFEGK